MERNKVQTAISFLSKRIVYKELHGSDIKDAEQVFKDQVLEAFRQGTRAEAGLNDFNNGEDYYNKTFIKD